MLALKLKKPPPTVQHNNIDVSHLVCKQHDTFCDIKMFQVPELLCKLNLIWQIFFNHRGKAVMKLLLMFPCKQANAVCETVKKTKQNKEEKTKNEMKTLWRLRES